MRNFLFLFTLSLSAQLYGQTITIKIEINKEVKISEGLYVLNLYNHADINQEQFPNLKILEEKEFLSFAKENNIEILNEDNLNDFSESAGEFLKYYLLSISKETRIAKLNKLLEKYTNDNLILVDYKIENYDLIEKEMLNEALEEARIEASKLASHLERKLDSVLNITVSKNSNEQGQNEAGSWNINKSIGWTAYPPLSALDMNGNTVANEMSIFVRKEYEISFNTINLD